MKKYKMERCEMKKNVITVATVITTSFFLLVSCTNKQYERVHHEKILSDKAEIETVSKTDFLVAPNVLNKNEILLQKQKENQEENQGQAVGSGAEILSQIIVPFSQYLLVDKITDRNYVNSREGQTVLSQLNRAILLLDQKQAKSLEEQQRKQYEQVLQTYNKVLLDGCMSKTLIGCKHYRFFRSDYNTAKVIQIFIRQLDKDIEKNQTFDENKKIVCKDKCEESLREYYRLVFYAYDLRNGILDKELEFFYIKRASVFGDILKRNPSDKENLIRHSKVFELIVNKFDVKKSSKSKQDFLEFVNYFSPWLYSIKSKDLFKKASQGLFRKAAVLYKENDQLQESLLEAVTTFEAQKGSFSDGLTQIQKKYPEILQKLKIDVSFFSKENIRNEYFFLVDRLYQGDHSFSESNALWSGILKDSKRLDQENKISNVMLAYLRLELAKRIIGTNEFMQEILKSDKVIGTRFMQKIIDESRREFFHWETFLKKTENLLIFTGQSFHPATIDKSKDYENLKKFHENLKSNISFLSVYPNMMMLVYYMKQTRSKLEFNTFWGKITIEPNKIISLLLDASLTPWFNFGNEKSKLGPAEILMSSYYLVSTDLFKTYSSFGQSEGVKQKDREFKLDFYATMLDGYIGDIQTDISDFHSANTSEIESNSGASYLQGLCTAINSKNSDSEGTVDQDIVTIPFERITNYVFVGREGALGDRSGPLSQVFFKGAKWSVIRSLRENLDQKINVINIMLQSLVDQEIFSETDKEIKNEINKKIAELQEKRLSAVREYTDFFVSLADCVDQLAQIEVQRQRDLLFEEEEYLRQIHRYMSELQENSGVLPPQELFSYLSDYSSKGENIKGYDGISHRPVIGDITKDSFEYSYYDSLLRMRWRLEGKSGRGKELAKIEMPTGALIETRSYYSENKSKTVQWVPDENQFVRNAMEVYSHNGGSYTQWMSPSVWENSTDFWEKYRRILFEAYIEGNIVDKKHLKKGQDHESFVLEQIVENEIRIWKKFNILEGSQEEKLLNLLKQTSFYSLSNLKSKMVTGAQTKKSLMDDVYSLFSSEGGHPSVSNRAPLERAKKFYKNMTDRLYLIYPLSDRFTCESTKSYETQMNERIDRRLGAEKFFQQYLTKKRLEEEELLYIRMSLDPDSSENINKQMVFQSGIPEVVSENLINNEVNYLEDKVKKAQNGFNKRYSHVCGDN